MPAPAAKTCKLGRCIFIQHASRSRNSRQRMRAVGAEATELLRAPRQLPLRRRNSGPFRRLTARSKALRGSSKSIGSIVPKNLSKH